MIRRVLIAALALLALTAPAQTATEPNEGSKLVFESTTGSFTFSFWGRFGRVYIIQNSDDLYMPWHDLPTTAAGTDAPISYGLIPSPLPERFFFRVRYFEVVPTDTDGDGTPDNLDAFPYDPTRHVPGSPVPGDSTAPLIFVDAPSNLVPL